jgi:hypothetical protein
MASDRRYSDKSMVPLSVNDDGDEFEDAREDALSLSSTQKQFLFGGDVASRKNTAQKSMKSSAGGHYTHKTRSIHSKVSISRHGDSFRTCGEGDREHNEEFEDERFDLKEDEGNQLIRQKTIGADSEGA